MHKPIFMGLRPAPSINNGRVISVPKPLYILCILGPSRKFARLWLRTWQPEAIREARDPRRKQHGLSWLFRVAHEQWTRRARSGEKPRFSLRAKEKRMSMERIPLAVVGLGDIAQKAHLPVLAARSDVEIVALTSQSNCHAAELIARHHLPAQAATLDQIIALRPAGALVLSTSSSHAELACRLLEAGIAVYLEKPMALDVASARQVAECADRTGQLLMVGFNRRYAPLHQDLKALFSDQRAGQCRLLKTRQRGGSTQSPAEAVWNDVIHQIDLSRWLMGDPQQIHAAFQYGPQGEFAGLNVLFQYADGRSTTLTHAICAGGMQERVELYGDGVSAWVDNLEVLQTQQGRVMETRTFDPWSATLTKRGFTSAHEHFLECLRYGRPAAQTAQDAFKSHELAQTILNVAGEEKFPVSRT